MKLNHGLGESVILTAKPFTPNVVFVGWAGDLVSTANPATLVVNGSKTVRARFASVVPLPRLVSWWRAENDARDIMGINHATPGAGITFGTGKVGRAFSFNGTAAAEVKVLASETLNVGTGNGFTIESWIKPTDAVMRHPLLEWHDGSRFGAHLWINVESPGSLYANVVDTAHVNHPISSPTGIIRANDWQHVAVTYDRTSGMSRLFLNGVQVAWTNLGIFIPLTVAEITTHVMGKILTAIAKYARDRARKKLEFSEDDIAQLHKELGEWNIRSDVLASKLKVYFPSSNLDETWREYAVLLMNVWELATRIYNTATRSDQVAIFINDQENNWKARLSNVDWSKIKNFDLDEVKKLSYTVMAYSQVIIIGQILEAPMRKF